MTARRLHSLRYETPPMLPKSQDTPLLKIENLKIRASGTEILKGVNWSVFPNQHWAILGANGCGKTTLLSALTAYATPTSGTIELFGGTYGSTEWEPLRKQIGIVSAALDRRIPPHELAVETVQSGAAAQLGYWHRGKVDFSDALKCLSKMGVRHLAERAWRFLSQGERQKVFIARALMGQAKLLILDEPCAGLDPVAREKFLQKLSKLARAKSPPGLVLVTHHIEEIFPEITHVLLLKNGKTFAASAKEEVLTSENISKTFEAKVEVVGSAQRYNLEIKR